jgi:hypothetical protein
VSRIVAHPGEPVDERAGGADDERDPDDQRYERDGCRRRQVRGCW